MNPVILTNKTHVGIMAYAHGQWAYEDLPDVVKKTIEDRKGRYSLIVAASYTRQGLLYLPASVIMRFDCVAVLKPHSTELDIRKDRSGMLLNKTVLMSPGLYMQVRNLAALV